MRFVRTPPPLVMRTLAAGGAGALLLLLGWTSLGGNDAGSTLLAFPLLSIGATLFMVSLGAAGLAVARVRRGERLSPLPAEPNAPAPLPRAILRPRR